MIEYQKLSVLCTGHGRNACGLQSFVLLIVLTLWSELFMKYYSILEKIQVHEKRCSLCGITPVYFYLKHEMLTRTLF